MVAHVFSEELCSNAAGTRCWWRIIPYRVGPNEHIYVPGIFFHPQSSFRPSRCSEDFFSPNVCRPQENLGTTMYKHTTFVGSASRPVFVHTNIDQSYYRHTCERRVNEHPGPFFFSFVEIQSGTEETSPHPTPSDAVPWSRMYTVSFSRTAGATVTARSAPGSQASAGGAYYEIYSFLGDRSLEFCRCVPSECVSHLRAHVVYVMY